MTYGRDIESPDPMELFDSWLTLAEKNEANDPTAAALATSTPDGAPSVRIVLAKRIGGHPFCFFTNVESRKGVELTMNPKVALCFHWKSLRRQVRVEGTVSQLEPGEVDDYFHSRSRASQIGAAVSQQSRILGSRAELEARVREFGGLHPGEIPRPDYWQGFEVRPERIEFWLDGEHRLHDRFLFTREGEGWRRERLYP